MTWKPMIERSTSTDTLLVSVEDDETDTMICECYYGTDQERVGYAKLIAAAPDLLETLYTVLPYIEDAEQDPAYKPGAVAKVTAQVRAAIAKATGGAA